MKEEDIQLFLENKSTTVRLQDIVNAISFLETRNIYVIKLLGSGSFGVVMLGEHKIVNQKSSCELLIDALVAVKVIVASGEKLLESCKREAQLMRTVTSNYTVQLIDCFGDTKNELYFLVMEYCSKGNLSSLIAQHQNQGGLSHSQIIQLLRGILQGLIDLSNQNIIHSDLKPENILLADDLQPKLCDFGLSQFISYSKTHVSFSGGTLQYQPLEQMNNKIYKETDYYACGGILYHLCGGVDDMNIFFNMKIGKFPAIEESNKNKELFKIAFSMMAENHKDRSTPQQVLKQLNELEDSNKQQRTQDASKSSNPAQQTKAQSPNLIVLMIRSIYWIVTHFVMFIVSIVTSFWQLVFYLFIPEIFKPTYKKCSILFGLLLSIITAWILASKLTLNNKTLNEDIVPEVIVNPEEDSQQIQWSINLIS